MMYLFIFYLLSRNFIFEVHAEKEKLLGNLDLAEAIACFLHLVFVFNLEYPKVKLSCKIY